MAIYYQDSQQERKPVTYVSNSILLSRGNIKLAGKDFLKTAYRFSLTETEKTLD